MEYRGYTARVVFDADAGVLFGEVEGLRDIVTFEATNVESVAAEFRESVDDYLDMCAGRGEEPDKPYSGKILVRADPALHRDLAQLAARESMSLNAAAADAIRSWIAQRHVAEPTVTYKASENAGSNERVPAASVAPGVSSAIVFGTDRPDASTPNSSTPSRVDTPSRSDTPAKPQLIAASGKHGENKPSSLRAIQWIAA